MKQINPNIYACNLKISKKNKNSKEKDIEEIKCQMQQLYTNAILSEHRDAQENKSEPNLELEESLLKRKTK